MASHTHATPQGETFTHFAYNPNLAANALYVTIFSIYLLAQCLLGLIHKTWDYTAAMLCGLGLEIAGYTARIFMRADPSARIPFLLNSAFLILSPAFLAASIYLCFGRIVSIYSTPLSPLSPRRILLLFVLCDIINLVLQGAGGALSSTSLTPNGIQAGLQVILAGLVTQVVSLLLFLVLCADFARRVRRGGRKLRKDTWELRQMGVWKAFLAGLTASTLAILIRSIFRIAELSCGYTGPLANNEATFMTLEGGMMIFASGALTVLHPGICFGEFWKGEAVAVESEEEKQGFRGLEKAVMYQEDGIVATVEMELFEMGAADCKLVSVV